MATDNEVVMTLDDVEAALKKAEQTMEPLVALGRSRLVASEEQMERMTHGGLAQHHADELVRLQLVAAAVWLGMGTADGQPDRPHRAKAVQTIRNVAALLPYLDHEPNVLPKM
jgi:hypothetical protein